ncbi:hypothetical protein K1T71_007701 [Dendrolimus kikuchii]|uniref:Uncharacterized protein n=1 Tax=Dendrolimus kikuchii TaxID=765133 RepID=A0ACC1CY51_9NEOP|nr:hypothetical protein K1T71_007701 [Dendrolimus kikuchii]
MSESNEEIRYILKFSYKKGKNATQAVKTICDVYGPNALSVRVAQIWFKRFQSENFDIKDARRSGHPVTDKIDAIFEKVEQDRHISSYDVAGELGIDQKTVLLRGMWAAYKRWGKLPWDSLIAPTLKLCDDGFQMSKALYDAIVLVLRLFGISIIVLRVNAYVNQALSSEISELIINPPQIPRLPCEALGE